MPYQEWPSDRDVKCEEHTATEEECDALDYGNCHGLEDEEEEWG